MNQSDVDAAELKQLRKEKRTLEKKLKRAQADLISIEQSKQHRESLHRQLILELQESQLTLEAQKAELQELLDDLSETQKQLMESEKLSALGRLVAGVAHEINTPVGTSITLASTLRDETERFRDITVQGSMKRSQLNHYLEIAQESTNLIMHNLNRAGELVQTFKQVAVDQSTHDHRPFELKAYLQDVFKSLQTFIQQKGHQYKLEGCSAYIEGHPGLFAQIITNFVMNSLNYAFKDGESGLLSLEISCEENLLTLIYRDNGCGIPEDRWSQIYEPFYTTGRHLGGTGLGLHIVYNIVTQKLKGNIQLSSILGQETQFKITIPVKILSQKELQPS